MHMGPGETLKRTETPEEELSVRTMTEDPESKPEGFRTQESMQDLTGRSMF